MKTLEQLTAKEILSVETPERLFTQHGLVAEYRRLIKYWHPDVNKDSLSPKVVDKLHNLKKEGKEKLDTKVWQEPPERVFEETPGIKKIVGKNRVHTIQSQFSREFELGKYHIHDDSVTYQLKEEYRDLHSNAFEVFDSFEFRDKAMEKEMGKYLPAVDFGFTALTGDLFVSIKKPSDVFLLKDVISNKKEDPLNYIGWTINALLNIACYLQYNEITHNGISSETVFISPQYHTGLLLGGWWYAVPKHAKMIALPPLTMEYMPPDVLRNKHAAYRTDLEMIKAIGREMLGDISGAKLRWNKDLPNPMVQWLNLPSAGNAVEDYKEWKYKVLPACFGKPKFIKFELTAKELYGDK